MLLYGSLTFTKTHLLTTHFKQLVRFPLLSLFRDDSNWICCTNSFIFLDGRRQSVCCMSQLVIFVNAPRRRFVLAFACPRGNNFLALTPDRNMTVVLQTAQSHRHFLKEGGGISFFAFCGKLPSSLDSLRSASPWLALRFPTKSFRPIPR